MKRINYKLLNALIALTIIYVLFLLRGLWGGVFVKILAILKPFIIAFVINLVLLCTNRTLSNKSYLYPLIPFNGKEFFRKILRILSIKRRFISIMKNL